MIGIIFFLALFALGASLVILWRRVLAIRAGAIAVNHLPSWSETLMLHLGTMQIAGKHFYWWLKRQSTYHSLRLVYWGLSGGRVILRRLERRFLKTTQLFHGHYPLTTSQAVSDFLQEIKIHQLKIKSRSFN